MSVTLLENVELCMWSLPDGDGPAVATVRGRLIESGLRPERAADVADTTAFRRAVGQITDELTTKEEPHKATFFNRKKDQVLCGQIDRIVLDADNKYVEREHISHYELQPVGEGKSKTFFPATTAGIGNGIAPAYQHAKEQYTWGDVSKVIHEILKRDGLGAYTPRKGGAVYFVPLGAASQLLDQLEGMAKDLGITFLRFKIPDNQGQRLEIAEAIKASILRDCQEHRDAINAYTVDTLEVHFDNRAEAINGTRALLRKITGFLIAGQLIDLNSELDALESLNAAALARAKEHQASTPRRRRIVTSEVQGELVNA